MALPQAKQDATDARLAALSLPDSAGWLKGARDAALARVRAMGLPHRRDEYWKYTRPETLVQPEVPETSVETHGEAQVFDAIDKVRLVFVDGVFDPEASDDPSMDGVTVERLADIAQHDIHWAKDLYGVLETRGQDPVHRPLAALNTAVATDGVVIHATGKATKPIAIVYRQTQPAAECHLHHLIKVDPGAVVTVLEQGPPAARFNTVMEADIADTGTLHHVRVQGREHDRRGATHVFTRLGETSVAKSFTLTFNGKLTRNEVIAEFLGEGGIAHIAGINVGHAEFHGDDTVFVTHDAVGCESRQVFKKVLGKGAHGVFQGKIFCKEGAQKTDGYQISQGLLLDDDSQFLAKPELEIYADDVACSHGSTSGAIDEDGLFYLRSRGVPKDLATDLMTLAFLAEAIEEIEDGAIAEDVLGRLHDWLIGRRA